jgi:phospholipid/cholesterol/gamma-HCH transport system ATP-binding protein
VEQGRNKDGRQNNDSNGIIAIENVTKKFGDNVVLDNISLSIEKGKTTAVIGPSGCGKTVLIKHLIALLRPNSGRVFFKNRRIDDLSENRLNKVRTQYGFLFQASRKT